MVVARPRSGKTAAAIGLCQTHPSVLPSLSCRHQNMLRIYRHTGTKHVSTTTCLALAGQAGGTAWFPSGFHVYEWHPLQMFLGLILVAFREMFFWIPTCPSLSLSPGMPWLRWCVPGGILLVPGHRGYGRGLKGERWDL